MSRSKTGGSAFPRAGNEWDDMVWVAAPAEEGMTLRDYFAAQALAGICANPENRVFVKPQDFASASYTLADEMLKARNE